MNSIKTLDNKVELFYKNLSRVIYRFSGLSNYFLAKLMVVIVMLSIWTSVINYWVPILSRKTRLVPLIFESVLAFGLVIFAYECDEADKRFFSNQKAKYNFFAFQTIPFDMKLCVWRITCLILSVSVILVFFAQTHTAPLIFDILDVSYFPALTSFWYFLTINPPSPAKSKIKEWAENIAAGFKKLNPIKASS